MCVPLADRETEDYVISDDVREGLVADAHTFGKEMVGKNGRVLCRVRPGFLAGCEPESHLRQGLDGVWLDAPVQQPAGGLLADAIAPRARFRWVECLVGNRCAAVEVRCRLKLPTVIE